jgi:hypothetical protein
MPEQENRRSYLHRELVDRLSRLASSVRWYRRRHYFGQMSSVFLSAVITIIAGFKTPVLSASAGSDIILVLGAALTVISAWSAFFSPHDFWLLSAATYGRFRALQAKMEFLERGDDFPQTERKAVEEVFAEYQQLIDAYDKKWYELRQKAK